MSPSSCKAVPSNLARILFILKNAIWAAVDFLTILNCGGDGGVMCSCRPLRHVSSLAGRSPGGWGEGETVKSIAELEPKPLLTPLARHAAGQDLDRSCRFVSVEDSVHPVGRKVQECQPCKRYPNPSPVEPSARPGLQLKSPAQCSSSGSTTVAYLGDAAVN